MSQTETKKKTSYQGSKRCIGYHHCDFGHRWTSAWSWANCGQKCRDCLKKKLKEDADKSEKELLATMKYTYPHAQEPLREIWQYCETCDEEYETRSSKPTKCRKCNTKMYPIIYLTCPHCKYDHGWADDLKKAYQEKFLCREYAEEGKGCDQIISKGSTEEGGERTGPHPNVLCEKCFILNCPCYGQRRRRKGRKTTVGRKGEEEESEPENTNRSLNKNQKRNRRRRNRESASKEEENAADEAQLKSNMDALEEQGKPAVENTNQGSSKNQKGNRRRGWRRRKSASIENTTADEEQLTDNMAALQIGQRPNQDPYDWSTM